MNRITTYLNSLGRATRTVVLALAVIFVSAGIAQAAATTISTNITTTGTLSVTGLSTLLGGATTTQLTLLSGDTLKNATASSTVLSADLTVGSGVSDSGDLVVTNNGNAAGTIATSTLTVGCINATATSSATQLHLIFSTTGATSTFAGTAYWGYGTCS
ncbi:MAG: hypothetical protein NUV60_03730 [Patescibacteria group bacterium]|nr:hypothetical protein [Patescibacteria group bacterium]